MLRKGLSIGALGLTVSAVVLAQNPPPPSRQGRIEVRPPSLSMDVGGAAKISATVYDSTGKAVEVPVIFFSSSGRSVDVDSTGLVRAHLPGEYRLYAIVFQPPFRMRDSVSVAVRWPPLKAVSIMGHGDRFYVGTTVRLRAGVTDAAGLSRDHVAVTWSSSDPAVLQVNRFGEVTALKTGTAMATARAEAVTGTRSLTVVANPARSITLAASADVARTGDVIHFATSVRDASGRPITDMPISYSLKAAVEDTVIASEPPALVDQDGTFVAQRAGVYTVFASAGSLVARRSIEVTHRHQSRKLVAARGQGPVRSVHTSDLWVWTGADGRDYAVTGTWGADGVANFWDVSDPATPVLVDTVRVDARTVNDVKVDAQRGICVISREGASNRRNGFVVLDCSNPRDVQVLSRFDEGLYGGVHNVFIWSQHVFAINQGRRFDIISIQDPRAPKRVGQFELDTPGHGIHDVWVVDGIAYSSNWQDGVVLIDVGNGVAGGSPSNPVKIGQYKYPIGATHSAFPYRSQSAGDKFYVFVGDEQFPYGLDPDDAQQSEAGGYVHVVDFTDLKNPVEVARYQIPEAGPHNFWVQNDTLYVAYYNAGLRVVDVSGELKGNLYQQGRELARFEAMDPKGKVANFPMAWGPQPHKGHIFFSDFNSGLWAVKLPERPATPIP